MALQWYCPYLGYLGKHIDNPVFVVLGPVSGTGSAEIEAGCLLWPAFLLWSSLFAASQKPQGRRQPSLSAPHPVCPLELSRSTSSEVLQHHDRPALGRKPVPGPCGEAAATGIS